MAVWQDKFIRVNKYSRPAKKLQAVRKLVLHWTANYGGTAENHYRYFNNLSDRYASAHIFVDKNEAICIIPLSEVAYHANDGSYRGVPELRPNANYLSIGVEMCVEKDGTFHPNTIARTEDVFVELCRRYKLNPLTDIVRHYDITHKNCPAPWVKDSQKFVDFKNRVYEKLKGTPAPAPNPTPSTPSLPVLRKGSRGEAVKTVQSLLNKKGYHLVVDGIFGTKTEDDVKDFQRKNGLVVDGIVGAKTWAKLNASVISPSPSKPKYVLPSGILKYGSRGTAVKQLQTALNACGFSCGAVDGIFGNKTLNALKSFQRSEKLVVDGIYGAKTRSALNKRLNG